MFNCAEKQYVLLASRSQFFVVSISCCIGQVTSTSHHPGCWPLWPNHDESFPWVSTSASIRFCGVRLHQLWKYSPACVYHYATFQAFFIFTLTQKSLLKYSLWDDFINNSINSRRSFSWLLCQSFAVDHFCSHRASLARWLCMSLSLTWGWMLSHTNFTRGSDPDILPEPAPP